MWRIACPDSSVAEDVNPYLNAAKVQRWVGSDACHGAVPRGGRRKVPGRPPRLGGLVGLILGTLTLFAPSTFAFAQIETERPPNVVIILADDLGYGDLSCNGGAGVETPRCDQLAKTGLRFTDMHAPAAVCTPSRYGILTGRYAWRTWLKDWVVNGRMPLLIEEGRYTLQRMFAENGYATACIGKWHLGWGRRPYAYQEGRLQPGPLETGFDYFFGLPYSHNAPMPEMNVYVRNREIVGLRDSEDIMDPEVQARLARDLDETARRLSSEAVRWIETHGDQPFFLYYPVANVHYPLTPGPRFKGKSGAGDYFFIYLLSRYPLPWVDSCLVLTVESLAERSAR